MLDIYKHPLSEYVILIAYGGCFVAYRLQLSWPYSVHVGFLREICLQVPWFPPGTVIPLMFCIYISFI